MTAADTRSHVLSRHSVVPPGGALRRARRGAVAAEAVRVIGPVDPRLGALPPAGGTGLVRPVAPTPPPNAIAAIAPGAGDALFDADTLDALLGRSDQVVARAPARISSTALALEGARGALVAGDPAGVLAALDAAWAGASRTEQGWFLRAAALVLLRREADARRLLADVMPRHAPSVALPFVDAVAALAVGELAAARRSAATARAALPLRFPTATPAGDAAAPSTAPVRTLDALEALLSAHAGDPAAALARLTPTSRRRRDAGAEHEPPVVGWARRAIASLRLLTTREVARPVSAAPAAGGAPAPLGDGADGAPARGQPLDLVTDMLRRIGTRLVGAPTAAADAGAVHRDIATMQQALAPGGAYAGAVASPRAHAARSLLQRLAVAVGVESRLGDPVSGAAATTPTLTTAIGTDATGAAAERLDVPADELRRRETLQRLVVALTRGDLWEAGVASRRVRLPGLEQALLQELLAGADAAQLASPQPLRDAARGGTLASAGEPEDAETRADALGIGNAGDGTGAPEVLDARGRSRDADERTLVRFGVVLLDRDPREAAEHAAESARDWEDWQTLRRGGQPQALIDRFDQSRVGVRELTPAETAYDGRYGVLPPGAQSAFGDARIDQDSEAQEPPSAALARAAALVCLAIAFAAVALRLPVIAVACAGGAWWIGARGGRVRGVRRTNSERD